jgi:hypothetical protein
MKFFKSSLSPIKKVIPEKAETQPNDPPKSNNITPPELPFYEPPPSPYHPPSLSLKQPSNDSYSNSPCSVAPPAPPATSLSLSSSLNSTAIDTFLTDYDPSLEELEIAELGLSHEIINDELYLPSHPSRDWIKCFVSTTGPGCFR